jgi:hypothetical protein
MICCACFLQCPLYSGEGYYKGWIRITSLGATIANLFIIITYNLLQKIGGNFHKGCSVLCIVRWRLQFPAQITDVLTFHYNRPVSMLTCVGVCVYIIIVGRQWTRSTTYKCTSGWLPMLTLLSGTNARDLGFRAVRDFAKGFHNQ